MAISQIQSEKRPLRLNVEYQFNGNRSEFQTHRIQPVFLSLIEQVKLSTDVLAGDAPGVARLDITLNDRVSPNPVLLTVRAVLFGVTFGGIGLRVDHEYRFTATFTPPGKPSVRKTYKHVLYVTAGNWPGPKGLTPKPIKDGFDEAIQQLTLNLLQDLQKDGLL